MSLSCTLVIGNQHWELKVGECYLVGSAADKQNPNFIHLPDSNIDTKHSLLEVQANGLAIYDLNTEHGTSIQEETLKPMSKAIVKKSTSMKFGNVCGKIIFVESANESAYTSDVEQSGQHSFVLPATQVLPPKLIVQKEDSFCIPETPANKENSDSEWRMDPNDYDDLDTSCIPSQILSCALNVTDIEVANFTKNFENVNHASERLPDGALTPDLFEANDIIAQAIITTTASSPLPDDVNALIDSSLKENVVPGNEQDVKSTSCSDQQCKKTDKEQRTVLGGGPQVQITQPNLPSIEPSKCSIEDTGKTENVEGTPSSQSFDLNRLPQTVFEQYRPFNGDLSWSLFVVRNEEMKESQKEQVENQEAIQVVKTRESAKKSNEKVEKVTRASKRLNRNYSEIGQKEEMEKQVAIQFVKTNETSKKTNEKVEKNTRASKRQNTNDSDEIKLCVKVPRLKPPLVSIADTQATTSKRLQSSQSTINVQFKNQPEVTVKICTTNISLNKCDLDKMGKGLWTLCDDMQSADVLVMDVPQRTLKFIVAIARGIPIVDSKWLINFDSKKTKPAYDKYLIKATAFQRQYRFNIKKTAQLAAQRRIFEGFGFLRAKNIRFNSNDFREIVKASGGIFFDSIKGIKKVDKSIYLISEDGNIELEHQNEQLPVDISIISTEGFLLAILRYNLELLEEHKLKPMDT